MPRPTTGVTATEEDDVGAVGTIVAATTMAGGRSSVTGAGGRGGDIVRGPLDVGKSMIVDGRGKTGTADGSSVL